MSPISTSSTLLAAAYDVAVAKKSLDNTREQGQQALALIQSAVVPPGPAVAPTATLGTRLDVRA